VETLAELPFIGDQVSRPAESHRRALAGMQERPRDRVPLLWAKTQHNLGNALGPK